MSIENEVEAGTIGPEVTPHQEVPMVRQERWEEIRRLAFRERVPIAEIARRLDLDRKTVRRCLRDTEWTAYRRSPRADTVLAPHAAYVRERAPRVEYSAQILFQELRQRGYRGSYDTVKLFVQPLRAAQLSAERTLRRFETPPGQQSQIDWGSSRVHFRHQPVVLHMFILTLGHSRRHFMAPTLDERVPRLLDSHERAFDHFGGHTREHTGTGLGLAICKELAGILQSEIQLVSEIGRGSMFSLIMPPTFGEEPAAESALEARFRGSLASGRKWD